MSLKRLIILPVSIILISILISTTIATAAGYPGANSNQPPMAPGDGVGSITGYVHKTVTTDRVPGIYVAIVNASNTSMIYATTTSDDNGQYRFVAVNSTAGGAAYRIIARGEGYDDGQTGTIVLRSGDKPFVNVQILPKENYAPTPDPSKAPGSVSGRVTEMGTGVPMSGAAVSIVSPTMPDTIYFTTTADQNGVFRFSNLNDFETSYQVRVSSEGYKDGYSLIFQVEPGVTTDMSVVMDHKPKEITPFPTRDPTVVDGSQASPTAQPAPGFGAILAMIASAIVVGIAGRKKE